MDFEDKVFQTLRNFMEYGNYQGKVDKAVAAIKKSYPQRSKEELIVLFERCIEAYKEAILLVKENIQYYSSENRSSLPAEIQFKTNHSQVPEQLLDWIIGWVYHWHHER
jgi:hypothetical protein